MGDTCSSKNTSGEAGGQWECGHGGQRGREFWGGGRAQEHSMLRSQVAWELEEVIGSGSKSATGDLRQICFIGKAGGQWGVLGASSGPVVPESHYGTADSRASLYREAVLQHLVGWGPSTHWATRGATGPFSPRTLCHPNPGCLQQLIPS